LLGAALRASRRKITIFLGAVVTLMLIAGAAMYLLEGEKHGFTSIPRSVYWAIVTMTTVGYGDIAPQTVPGQFLASVLMIMGYGIIAVPTGIVTVELAGCPPQRHEHEGLPELASHLPKTSWSPRGGALEKPCMNNSHPVARHLPIHQQAGLSTACLAWLHTPTPGACRQDRSRCATRRP